jgi:hypothetical protein
VRCRKDGTLLDISLSVSPFTDAQGRIVGMSKIARGITERKRQQRDRELLINYAFCGFLSSIGHSAPVAPGWRCL